MYFVSAPAGAGLNSIIERVLHGEYRVVLGVLAATLEHLRGQILVTWRADAEVEVRRTIGMPVHHSQQISGGAVERDGIGDRTQRTEGVASLRIGPELAAQIIFRLVRVLLLVEPVRRAFPDIEDGILDRLAVGCRGSAPCTSTDSPGGPPCTIEAP